MSEHKKPCAICRGVVSIALDDKEEEAAREIGLHIDEWVERYHIICEPCRIERETGRRPTNTPPMKDFLFE